MVELEFKIVYEGRLKAGADKEKFIRVFSKHFNMPEAKARKLADARTDVVIKRNVNRDEALKIKKGLEAIGMVVRVEVMGGPTPAAQEESAAEKTQFMAPPPGFDSKPPRRAHRPAVDEATQFMEPPSGFIQTPPSRRGHRPAIDEETQFMEPPSGFVSQMTPDPAAAEEEMQSFRVPPLRSFEDDEDEDENPYAAPEANLEAGRARGGMTGPTAVGVGRGWGWIKEGYGYFRDSPIPWIVALILWTVIAIAVQLIPFVGAISFMLLNGFFIAGFMLGVREQEEGRPFAVQYLFAGFSRNPVQLLLVEVIYLLGYLGIGIGSFLVVGGSVFIPMLFGQPPDPAALEVGMGRFWIAILLGIGLGVPLAMAFWFAPALVAIEGMAAIPAMRASFMGCLKNILPFLLFGVITMGLMIVAVIPVGLGLLVMLPTLMAAMYVSFRDIYYADAAP